MADSDDLQRIFDRAVGLSASDREAFLDQACRHDTGLRVDVERLLVAHEALGSAFESTPSQNRTNTSALPRRLSLSPGRHLGPYEVIAPLGAGGMGEVYRARDTRLDRNVAVKVLPASLASDPERRARFEREARVAARLEHPNVVPLYDVGVDDHTPYIVSELLEGMSLRESLVRGAVGVRRAVQYAIQIAEGLAAAHERGIVHRDLKPENVFVLADGRVKILDFGIAKLLEPVPDDSPLGTAAATNPGAIVGTVAYMSPEQIRGEAVDHRADIFSFGVVLYELLSGRRPFAATTAAETMTAILRQEPPELPADVPRGLEALVGHCLEKRPARRFQSTRDIAFALEAFSQPTGSSSQPEIGTARPDIEEWLTRSDSSVGGPAKRSLGNRVAWALSAVLVLATLGLATVAYERRSSVSTSDAAPEVRLELTTPADSQFNVMSLSPDGTNLVYQAGGQLWLRALSSLSSRPLTAGGENVFWSPDGQSIGYFHDKKLNRLDFSSGAVQTLARAPEAIGASWNRDGTILFVPGLATPVRRIDANGGQSSDVTRLVSGHTGHRFPQFLPDGRHFLYVVAGTPEVRGTYLASLDSPDGHRLIESVFQPIFMAPDWLLYVSDGALVAQKLNLSTLNLVGQPVQIAPRVGINSPRYNGVAATAAAGRIAYRVHEGSFRFVWADRHGQRLATIGDPEDVEPIFVELSRDGRRLVNMRTVEGNSDVWLVDIDRGTRRRVTHDPARDSIAVWSPDGRDLFYASERTGVFAIYRIAADGSSTESLVTSGAAPQLPTDVSADGQLLCFRQQNPAGGDTLWTLRLDGHSKPTRLTDTPFEQRAGRFSPDGRWIVYQSNETGRWEVYLRRIAGPTSAIPISTSGGLAPFWRPDGRELFFTDAKNRLIAVPVTVATESATVRNPVTLFDVAENYVTRQTLDGERFLIVERTAPPPPITFVLNWGGRYR
jgi:eukaryotic-like serine/threonine-protein kinase